MTEKDIFEKYANLRKTKLNAKNNKEVYPKSDVMTTNIKRWKGEKEHEVKSKIGNIFVNEKNTQRICCQDLWNWSLFFEHFGKNIQVDENRRKDILFRTDVYFTEYFLLVEIDEKGHTDRDLIFEEERQEALEKTWF